MHNIWSENHYGSWYIYNMYMAYSFQKYKNCFQYKGVIPRALINTVASFDLYNSLLPDSMALIRAMCLFTAA